MNVVAFIWRMKHKYLYNIGINKIIIMFKTCFTLNNDGNYNIISRKSNEIYFDNFLNAYTVLRLIRLTEFIRRSYGAELSWKIWWSTNKALAFCLLFETSRKEYGIFRAPFLSFASNEVWYMWGRPTSRRIPLQSVGTTQFCQLISHY